MSGHVSYCLNRSNEFREKGATEFIAKPFPTEGRTLTRLIRRVLRAKQTAPAAKGSPGRFTGGEVVLYSNRIEICALDIPLSKSMRQVFGELNATRPSGIYVAYTGEELADLIGCERGQNGIAEMVRDFRNRSTERLLEEGNVICDRFEIIQSGGPGYRLNPQVKVRIANDPNTGAAIDTDDPANDPANAPDDPADNHVDHANDRQRWILAELLKGAEIRVATVAARCGCSPATAKRDLAQMRKRNLIRFEGPSKTGCYRLVERGGGLPRNTM